MELKDQVDRDRFINEHNCNFSVIAPAGVGKTTAITKRIASIVCNNSIPLDKLVVVTYTKKASEELSLRTLTEVQKSTDDCSFLDKVFFGTIHAYADSLLREFGKHLGIANTYKIVNSVDKLWQKFLSTTCKFENVRDLEKYLIPFVNIDSLREMAKNTFPENINCDKKFDTNLHHLDLEELFKFDGKKNNSIKEFQKNLELWQNNPEYKFPYPETKAREFSEFFQYKTEKFFDNLSHIADQYVAMISKYFLEFRVEQQKLTFSDLIYCSKNLLKVDEIKSEILGRYVILDEAQDTDVDQFSLLFGVARCVDENFLRPGHFCMVGDAQQSIYSGRADVNNYLHYHKTLCEMQELEELKFSVTMRFGQRSVNNVNRVFENILDGKDQQVTFQKMYALKDYPLDNWYQISCLNVEDESLAVAEMFKGKYPCDFYVNSWSEIAILCARKDDLQKIEHAFTHISNVPQIQNHSNNKVYGNDKLFSYVAAFAKLITEPTNKLELYGILRKIFRCDDVSLQRYFQKNVTNDLIESALSQIEPLFNLITASPLHALSEILRTIAVNLNVKYNENYFSNSYSKSSDFIMDIDDGYENCNVHNEVLEHQPLSKLFIECICDEYEHVFLEESEMQLIQLALESDELIDFANVLYQKYYEPSSTENIDENALQLCTFHKSKGLEWKIVIIPFLNKAMYSPAVKYPRLIDGKIALNKDQFDRFQDNPMLDIQNFERLLYVAFTRQKYATIFINDGNKPGKNSITDVLNRNDFQDFLSYVPEFKSAEISKNNLTQLKKTCNLSYPGKVRYDNLNINKQNFESIDDVLHEYAESQKNLSTPVIHPSVHDKSNSIISGYACLGDTEDQYSYGLWWHRTMEKCDLCDVNCCKYLLNAVKFAPNVTRADNEIRQLIACNDFHNKIRLAKKIFTEYHFTVYLSDSIVDGQVDLLLVYDTELIIIDYKTDQVGYWSYFIDNYSSQMSLYKSSLRQVFTGYNVICYIYSSYCGAMNEI